MRRTYQWVNETDCHQSSAAPRRKVHRHSFFAAPKSFQQDQFVTTEIAETENQSQREESLEPDRPQTGEQGESTLMDE